MNEPAKIHMNNFITYYLWLKIYTEEQKTTLSAVSHIGMVPLPTCRFKKLMVLKASSLQSMVFLESQKPQAVSNKYFIYVNIMQI